MYGSEKVEDMSVWVSAWRTGVIATLINELTLWLDSVKRSEVTRSKQGYITPPPPILHSVKRSDVTR